jgi:hypothetical protein
MRDHWSTCLLSPVTPWTTPQLPTDQVARDVDLRLPLWARGWIYLRVLNSDEKTPTVGGWSDHAAKTRRFFRSTRITRLQGSAGTHALGGSNRKVSTDAVSDHTRRIITAFGLSSHCRPSIALGKRRQDPRTSQAARGSGVGVRPLTPRVSWA